METYIVYGFKGSFAMELYRGDLPGALSYMLSQDNVNELKSDGFDSWQLVKEVKYAPLTTH